MGKRRGKRLRKARPEGLKKVGEVIIERERDTSMNQHKFQCYTFTWIKIQATEEK
jgi:hypothetical protein